MTPIPGLVKGKKMGFLEIRLRSGAVVHVPEQKDLAFGDQVWICFDFEKMAVQEVLTNEEYYEADKFEEPPDEDPPYPWWMPAHEVI